LKTTVIKKIKSLKKQKKPKTLTEKAKEKFRSLSKSVHAKLPGQEKKEEKEREKASSIEENQTKISTGKQNKRLD